MAAKLDLKKKYKTYYKSAAPIYVILRGKDFKFAKN